MKRACLVLSGDDSLAQGPVRSPFATLLNVATRNAIFPHDAPQSAAVDFADSLVFDFPFAREDGDHGGNPSESKKRSSVSRETSASKMSEPLSLVFPGGVSRPSASLSEPVLYTQCSSGGEALIISIRDSAPLALRAPGASRGAVRHNAP